MKRSNPLATTAATAVGLLLLTITGWLSYETISRLLTAAQLVSHTHQVQNRISTLLADLIDSEDRRRAYLLTHDSKYLRPPGEDATVIDRDVQQLKALTADNPRQQQRIEQIIPLVEKRLALLRQLESTANTQKPATGATLELIQNGTEVMDDLRAQLNAMQAEEDALLYQRQEASSLAHQRTALVILFGNTLALLFLMGAGWKARRELHVRLQTEDDLRRQRNDLQLILSSIGDGVIVANEKGEFLLFNPAAERILGLGPTAGNPEEWSARYGVYYPDSRLLFPSADLPLMKAMRGESVDGVELRIGYGPDDPGTIVSVTGRPLKSEDGGLRGGVIAFSDITERVERRKRHLLYADELAEANRDLQAKNQEIAAFYHTLSHELKTPLTSAREFITILLDGLAGQLDDTQREYLYLSKQSCDQMAHCINDLLDVARAETGKLEVRMEPVSLTQVIATAAAWMRPSLEAKGVKLMCDLSSKLKTVEIDSRRITQVLLNLLGNARKYTQSGGEIRIEATEEGNEPGFLQVSVTNKGPIIDPGHLEKIFDRLYQVRNGDAASQDGLGLGLYICRQLIRAHGGRIWAENIPQWGPRFTFTLRTVPEIMNQDVESTFTGT